MKPFAICLFVSILLLWALAFVCPDFFFENQSLLFRELPRILLYASPLIALGSLKFMPENFLRSLAIVILGLYVVAAGTLCAIVLGLDHFFGADQYRHKTKRSVVQHVDLKDGRAVDLVLYEPSYEYSCYSVECIDRSKPLIFQTFRHGEFEKKFSGRLVVQPDHSLNLVRSLNDGINGNPVSCSLDQFLDSKPRVVFNLFPGP